MLALAADERGDEMIALTSVRKVNALLQKEGMTFSDLLNHSHPLPVNPASSFQSHTQMKTTIAELQAHVRTLGQENAKLKRELAAKANKPKADKTSSVSYGAFAAEVINRLGKPKGWQGKFAAHAGVTVSQINSWNAKGVPYEYYEMAKTIPPAEKFVQSRPVDWTLELVNLVRSLSGKVPEREIAERIGKKVGWVVTEGQIKRLKINSREGLGVFADPRFGGPIGTSRI